MRSRMTVFLLAWAFAALPAAAQDVDGVIALPMAPSKTLPIPVDQGDGLTAVVPYEQEMPFIIPKLSSRVFPDDRSVDVLTQRNNNDRTGASYVRGLNAGAVRSFRKLGELAFDGVITAQPLFAHSAQVGGQKRSVLIVATSNNNIYAVDPTETLKTFWKVMLDAPTRIANGVNLPVPPASSGKFISPGAICLVGGDFAQQDQGGGSLGVLGIEATPVIDLANNQVIVSYRNAQGLQWVAAIDLDSAKVKKAIVVDKLNDFDASNNPPVPTADKVYKFGKSNRSRAGLLLLDGVVYIAYASLCETHSYGSIQAFDAKTLKPVGAFDVTSGSVFGGGVWQGGTGLAADDKGDLYFSVGNRIVQSEAENDDAPNLANSAVRLHATKVDAGGQPTPAGAPYDHVAMRVADSFTPYRKIWQDWGDLDL